MLDEALLTMRERVSVTIVGGEIKCEKAWFDVPGLYVFGEGPRTRVFMAAGHWPLVNANLAF